MLLSSLRLNSVVINSGHIRRLLDPQDEGLMPHPHQMLCCTNILWHKWRYRKAAALDVPTSTFHRRRQQHLSTACFSQQTYKHLIRSAMTKCSKQWNTVALLGTICMRNFRLLYMLSRCQDFIKLRWKCCKSICRSYVCLPRVVFGR